MDTGFGGCDCARPVECAEDFDYIDGYNPLLASEMKLLGIQRISLGVLGGELKNLARPSKNNWGAATDGPWNRH
jgi:hypothetical protein